MAENMRNYVLLVDKQGKEVLPVTDGKAVFVGDGSVKLNDKLTALEGKIGTNASEIARVEGSVATLEGDKADKTQVASDIATAKQELQANIDLKANVADLGTAAYKEVGTAEGQIPVLGVNGKLDESMLPSIAINEHFDAVDEGAAMLLTIQNGDTVFVGADGVGTTYICVNVSEATFEKRFRPLTSSADFITKAEIESKLANKVDNSTLESYKGEVASALANKVENSDLEVYKLEVQSGLDAKATKSDLGAVATLTTTAKVVVDAINEVKGVADGAKAKATQNASDLADYKEKVTGLLAGKADEGHTHSEYALKSVVGDVSGLNTDAKDTLVKAINEVKSGVDTNASAVATKVESSVFEAYKEEVTGALALKADQTALEELGGQLEGCIRFRVFDIESEDLKLA